MKKILYLILFFSLCFSLFGCAEKNEKGETFISEEIIEKLSATKTIVINTVRSNGDDLIFNKNKTITSEEEIDEILTIISDLSIENVNGPRYSILPQFKLEMLDADNNIVALFWAKPIMYLEIDEAEYNFIINKVADDLMEILER